MIAVLSGRALADLISAARWIARDNPSAAISLRREVRSAGKRIGRHPEIGVLRPDLAPEPYRFVSLAGFPYPIVYDAAKRPPVILRLLHGARDLGQALRK